MVVPVARMLGVPVAVVQIVEVVAVLDRRVPAALAVLVAVPVVCDVPARLALVPVAGVLAVQMSVVRVVDVVPVRYLGVTAVRTVGVLVGRVFGMQGCHGAHLRKWRGVTAQANGRKCHKTVYSGLRAGRVPRRVDAMKAISYSRYGGPEVLEYGDVRDPKVGPDSVLVKVCAASVNPVDWKAREGYFDAGLEPVFPVVPGWDVSGVVVRPGAAGTVFAVGEEVIGYVREDFLSRGTFAEYVAAPLRTLARKPPNLSFEEAAGLPLVGLTAYQVLIKVLDVQEGDTVLVHAAAGGVGSIAVQLAHHLGARVIGTASESNHAFVRNLGGEPVTYGEGLAERVRALAPDGVDAAFDTIGGDTLRASAQVLAPKGRLVSIADPEVIGLGGRYYFVRPDADDLQRLSDLAGQGVVSVHVSQALPLERAAEAHRLNAEGRTRGKIVVTVEWSE